MLTIKRMAKNELSTFRFFYLILKISKQKSKNLHNSLTTKKITQNKKSLTVSFLALPILLPRGNTC